jgi:NitT/TauT family transport system ATP-binding protein
MTASLAAHADSHAALVQLLPQASINRMLGFLETLAAAPRGGEAELGAIAGSLALEINELFPIAAALQILEFAESLEGRIRPTAAGRMLVQADTQERKRLFREHLLRFVPLAAHIVQVLEEREGHHAPRARFELELQDHLNDRDAERTLAVVTDWGRYAEILSYDAPTRSFTLTA